MKTERQISEEGSVRPLTFALLVADSAVVARDELSQRIVLETFTAASFVLRGFFHH